MQRLWNLLISVTYCIRFHIKWDFTSCKQTSTSLPFPFHYESWCSVRYALTIACNLISGKDDSINNVGFIGRHCFIIKLQENLWYKTCVVQMSSPRGRLIQASDSRTLNYKNERTMGVVISNRLLTRSIETGTESVHVKLSNNVAMSESLMVYRNKNLWSDQ